METLGEPHRTFIVQRVHDHFEKHNKPILLSDLGTLFAHEYGRFSTLYTTQMKERIEQDMSDDLGVVRHPNVLQKIYVAPIDKLDAAQRFVEAGLTSSLSQETPSEERTTVELSKLQRAVLFAFQVAPAAGENVYLTSSIPIRFEILPEPPSSRCLLLIEPEFSLSLSKPKQYDDLADSEKRQLSEKIDAWAQKHAIDIRRFYFRPDRSSQTASQRSSLTALERLINAQNEETRKQLLIPADIVQYLLKI